MPGSSEFEGIIRVAHELADLSGPVILEYFRKSTPVENKAVGGAFDPVTIADRGAEKAIAEGLATRFPDHGIVGEEFGTKAGSSAFQWVIDPIDGTRSFIMGSPLWGTLIGVLKDGTPYLGLMDQPFTGERFWSGEQASYHSIRGGKPARLTSRRCERIEDAVLTSTHPDLFEGEERIAVLERLKAEARLTRYGGDCYGYCLLAAGHVDLIIESGLEALRHRRSDTDHRAGGRLRDDLGRVGCVEWRRYRSDRRSPAARGRLEADQPRLDVFRRRDIDPI